MRKILLILAAFFVLSATPSFAIYRTDGPQPTPKDGEMMLMSATEDPTEKSTAKTTATSKMMEAKDAMKSTILAGREAFKEKIKGIKDTRKQKIVEGFDTRVNEMNKKKTEWMNERLTRFLSIIEKLSTKAASMKAEGDDTTQIEADIAAAKTTVTNAQTSVAEQAAKDYVMEVTTDTALKTGARALIKEFMTDIRAVHEDVKAAQMAVLKAARGTGMMGEGAKNGQ